jgi:hypothetical protein
MLDFLKSKPSAALLDQAAELSLQLGFHATTFEQAIIEVDGFRALIAPRDQIELQSAIDTLLQLQSPMLEAVVEIIAASSPYCVVSRAPVGNARTRMDRLIGFSTHGAGRDGLRRRISLENLQVPDSTPTKLPREFGYPGSGVPFAYSTLVALENFKGISGCFPETLEPGWELEFCRRALELDRDAAADFVLIVSGLEPDKFRNCWPWRQADPRRAVEFLIAHTGLLPDLKNKVMADDLAARQMR